MTLQSKINWLEVDVPSEKGMTLSLSMTLPDSSRKRSGRNCCGSCQSSGSMCTLWRFTSTYSITTTLCRCVTRNDDDDDELKSYVCPLVQLETVTSVLMIRFGINSSVFRSRRNVDVHWQLHSGAGREFQVDDPATAKLLGPHRSVLVAGTARSPRVAERRWWRPALMWDCHAVHELRSCTTESRTWLWIILFTMLIGQNLTVLQSVFNYIVV